MGDRASEVVDYVKSYLFGDKGDDDDAGDSLDSNEVDDEYKGHPASKYTGTCSHVQQLQPHPFSLTVLSCLPHSIIA